MEKKGGLGEAWVCKHLSFLSTTMAIVEQTVKIPLTRNYYYYYYYYYYDYYYQKDYIKRSDTFSPISIYKDGIKTKNTYYINFILAVWTLSNSTSVFPWNILIPWAIIYLEHLVRFFVFLIACASHWWNYLITLN